MWWDRVDNVSEQKTERWRGVVAALLNDDVRAVIAETVSAPLTPKRRERALAQAENAGLVRRGAGDAVIFDDTVIRELLASAPRPTGPERFLDREGRIDRYPADSAQRRALLAWIAVRAFSPGDVLTETEVNDRVRAYAPNEDVAVLRRYLVDHQLLERTRSGSEYAVIADD